MPGHLFGTPAHEIRLYFTLTGEVMLAMIGRRVATTDGQLALPLCVAARRARTLEAGHHG